jgi:hypothetical protein
MIDCTGCLARAMGERAKKTVCDQRWRYNHSFEWFKELELLLTLLRLRPANRHEPAAAARKDLCQAGCGPPLQHGA